MIKGDLVEEIVALLHNEPDVVITPKAKLRSRQNPRKRRDIDVLVTGWLAGHEIHLAVECKNYGRRVKVGEIGEFRDRLDDVGIPHQHGIYVSVLGFTDDARDRAAQLGMRTLVLEGLTVDRLTAEVHEAFQSVVYLLLAVTDITVTSEAAEGDDRDFLWLRGKDGKIRGGILDLIWAKWRDGQLPTELGEYPLPIDVPPGWRWLVRGQPVPTSAMATIRVMGLVVTVPGQAKRFVLRDATTGNIERGRIDTMFETERRTFPVTTVRTEEELEAVLGRPALSKVSIGRIPLPRIRYDNYWPPSERVAQLLVSRAHELMKQGKFGPGAMADISFEELEGTDLSAIWEPIAAFHPASRDWQWPSSPRRGRHASVPRVPARGRRRRGTRSRRPA